MKLRRLLITRMACAALIVLQGMPPAEACTIFVLTNGRRAFFANNEDWSDPRTRIWFVPETEARHGCVFVGFQNHWAQGGMNTKGLAFDWVAGYKETYVPGSDLQSVKGNPSEEMIQTCATVDDAIRFYQRYREPSFSYARILIADRTGASVIVRASGGHLEFDKARCSRGFGYAGETVQKLLATNPPPSAGRASQILRACLQEGAYATKYSNVFDLKSGDIFLEPLPGQEAEAKMGLVQELEKGEHFYDLPRIHEQLKQPPRLWPSLKTCRPIADANPELTAKIQKLIRGAMAGEMRAQDFTPGFWNQIAPNRETLKSELTSFGDLLSVTRVSNGEEPNAKEYRYRLEFKSNTLLQRFVLDEDGRVSDVSVEDSQR